MRLKALRFTSGVAISALAFAQLCSAHSYMTAAPDFNFTLNGRAYQLSGLRGHVVVLDFWASWCGPCQRSLPEVSRLNSVYGDDVLFLGINNENTGAIEATVQRLGLSFPTILDASRSISAAYGVQYLPTSVVIDRNGRIANVIVGFRTDGSLQRAIEFARAT
jgi:thiol-disulfide isomerase/thioredoxin